MEVRCPQITNFRPVRGTKLYRTANMNRASEKAINDVIALNIKTVIDFRSQLELHDTQISSLNDAYLMLATKDNSPYYTMDSAVRNDILCRDGRESGKSRIGLQYNCNFVDFELIRRCLWECPWYWKPCFTLRYLVDRVFYGYVKVSMPVHMYMRNTGNNLTCLTELADWKGSAVNDALRLLSTPGNCPAALMCSSGKDRTGIISALIQIVCGVDRETVIADYAQSDIELAPVRQGHIAYMASHGMKAEMAYAPPEAMSGFIEHIDSKYGSVPGYLESIGFCSMMQEKLRQNVQTNLES